MSPTRLCLRSRLVAALLLGGVAALGLAAGDGAAARAGESAAHKGKTPSRRAGTSAPTTQQPSPSHITSIHYKTWIWEKPDRGGKYLGYVRIGQHIALHQPDKVIGQGCARGFFAVKPRGYVCHDRTVSLSDDTPFLRANAHTLPKPGPYPYKYALSNGAPMYARVPSADEQRRNEARYGKVGDWIPLPMYAKGHEHLAVKTPIAPDGPMPSFLENGGGARGKPLALFKRSLPHGAMVAYTRSFNIGGRTFLLSNDLTLVPADRVRRFKHTHFRGVHLSGGSGDMSLPLAWFRTKPRPQYQLVDGQMRKSGAMFALRSHAGLSGRTHQHDGRTFHEVLPKGSGIYADEADATIVRHYGRRPFGVKPGEKWVMVSILNGTLVAYDDLKAVFTTLISPGQGGLPRRGGDLVKDSTTPLGSYRITSKDRAATMSPEMGSNRSFWIADVPNTQYFSAPFALHAAFWHEKYGEPMSGGCVNLSPIDAQWLFGWTDPQVPEGWQAVVAAKANGPTSAVIITR